ncbi:class I SAM-dependent methyltransferase [Haladaptatus cibarius]|uniref:class I SAM-dependent methyltransferase n=1 Tax=Haladaptatus cibarius TaxID=453847 RepID=UPI0006794392|nr:class I SAM-dependent methyltransferase [Haladaptatus cibarius]
MLSPVWWNRIRYRLYAPIYDRITKPLEQGRREAIELLDLDPNEKLLIVGCGTGADLEYIPRGVDITAVDLTPEMVRRTVASAERIGHEIDSQVMDARLLSFDDNEFDAVILHLILAVVPEPSSVVSEVSRVLVQGGRVSIYDKFLPMDEEPSLPRRLINPLASALFSDLNRRLEPMVDSSDLSIEVREPVFNGLYTVAIVRK